ncbi:MAG TPA: branched-chain amino acid ABC transporter ATP-binding protein/permease [Acidimicrobiales bacterium]|nr:branched-chain amino acid ABC transporter ATP-binding protein/permease [Acidimicrobiales bacterium]
MQTDISYVNTILVFAVFAVSLNLLMGYTGQVSIAQAAFGAVGGYTVAYSWLNHQTPLPLALLIGMVFAFLIGVLVGIPALRLTTEWLILLTLAVQTIILSLATTSKGLGGTYGLQGVSGQSFFGLSLQRPSDFFWVFLVLAFLVFITCRRMGESPYGRVLRGIREDESATRALGKNIFAYKLAVFGTTSAMAALAGGMLVAVSSVASPSTFSFDQSTAIIAMVILGGMGNLVGSVLGAAVIVLSTPFLEHVVKLSPQNASLWRLVAYGLVLVVIMMLRPQGLLPEGTSYTRRILSRLGIGRRLALPASEVASIELALAGPVEEAESEPVPEVNVDVPEPFKLVEERRRHRGEVVLAVRGLSKRFGGIVAADGVDLDLHRGTITALVGPNGAGKTTIFNLLTGAIRPDAGSVMLKGEEMVGLTPDQVARKGMVRSFQDVRIFPRLSALQNVAMAVQNQPGEHILPLFLRPRHTSEFEKKVRDTAMEWLTFVGMDSFAGVPTGALAFGQQKLVALARVLATEAEVLLLDEPASGIDVQWVDTMLGLIEQLRPKGRTVCIVEHNLHVVGRLADHTYFMELGKITAQGSFEELTGERRLAEAYFGTA